MMIARTLPDLHKALAALGEVALVPTMGALHDGHLSLLTAARAENAATAVSIFVNPLQFSAAEDLSRYPRDEEGDLAKLKSAGCNLVWLPEAAEMYPPDAACTINVTGPATHWEGALRPGHFAGVATVVTKLFGQIRPRNAYFGEKDWQQIQVLRRVTQDFLLPTQIIAVPTVREPDGLALSSRNRFLSPTERAAAPALYAALTQAAAAITQGEPIASSLESAKQNLLNAGLVPDYLSLVNAISLEPITALRPPARLLAAAKLGTVRLLDNLGV
jgi:pantoate--beta-alanine ligase